MDRLQQAHGSELEDLMVANLPGETAMDTCGFYAETPEARLKGAILVAAPQRIAEDVFLRVEQFPDSELAAELASDSPRPIHDILGIPDEVIVYRVQWPARRAIARSFARVLEAQSFPTRAKAWGELEFPVAPPNVELNPPVDSRTFSAREEAASGGPDE